MTIYGSYIVSTFLPVFCEDILYLEHYNSTIPPAPVPKLKRGKHELKHKPTIDKYTAGIQTRPTLVSDDDSPLLTLKEVFQPTKQLKSPADITSEGKTPVSQVMPLLGTTPSENNQIQHNCKSTQNVPATCRRG